MSNPAVASLLEGGELGWQHLFGLPLLVIAAVLVAVRLRSLRDTDYSLDQGANPVEHQTVRTTEDAGVDSRARQVVPDNAKSAAKARDDKRTEKVSESREAEEASEPRDVEEASEFREAEDLDELKEGKEESAQFSILTGQGGTRNRDFEIEEEPPEVELGAHLDHLRDTLGDNEELREDLESFEAVVEQEASDNPVPARCPEPHCNALWSERGILGWGSGKYEILDDDRTIVCLSCESTHTVGEPE